MNRQWKRHIAAASILALGIVLKFGPVLAMEEQTEENKSPATRISVLREKISERAAENFEESGGKNWQHLMKVGDSSTPLDDYIENKYFWAQVLHDPLLQNAIWKQPRDDEFARLLSKGASYCESEGSIYRAEALYRMAATSYNSGDERGEHYLKSALLSKQIEDLEEKDGLSEGAQIGIAKSYILAAQSFDDLAKKVDCFFKAAVLFGKLSNRVSDFDAAQASYFAGKYSGNEDLMGQSVSKAKAIILSTRNKEHYPFLFKIEIKDAKEAGNEKFVEDLKDFFAKVSGGGEFLQSQ